MCQNPQGLVLLSHTLGKAMAKVCVSVAETSSFKANPHLCSSRMRIKNSEAELEPFPPPRVDLGHHQDPTGHRQDRADPWHIQK